MQVCVLGPLRVDADSYSVPLGGRRPRIVLALMALESNRTVTVDRMVDAVWGSTPPDSARTQIRICVSFVRRALADAGAGQAVETVPGGYSLRLATTELDAAVFTERVHGARALAKGGCVAQAVRELRTALALWRGPALPDASCPAVDAEARRLEENRMRAEEERISWELELGRHEDLVGELVVLTAEHPFRERLHALLMLALWRSGRTVEALTVYRRMRSVLVEELGIEPSPELRELERAILLGSRGPCFPELRYRQPA